MDALHLSLHEVAQALRARKLSSVELAQAALARIQATEPKLNAFVRTTERRALAAAEQADRELAAGHWRGALHGVPVAVKDLYDMAGLPTTASSKVRHDHVAGQDAACVRRLAQAGAVIIGKTHTHEFAYGVTTPTTGNPWDPERTPGGSSGGSAAAVAARDCFLALGTDTGGSIRIPAGLCGLVGLKPTFGRVSRVGITSLSWSLDHAGPLARTVADAAIGLQAIAGFDARDTGSADVPVADYLAELELGVQGLRIGVPHNFFFAHVDAEVERAVRAALADLERAGAELVDVEIPLDEQIVPVEFGLLMPEASSYHQKMLRERADLYGADVRALLELGEMLPATAYLAAQRRRTQIKAAWQQMFDAARLDALIGPAVAAPAALRTQLDVITWPDGTVEPLINAYARLEAPGNVTGLPSIAVPCGFTAGGLPVGFQALGRPFAEARIVRIARAYERLHDWSTRAPAL
ncbi:MAG: Asp-tRNA(Asn)/Glu-tRNA(Gln) amidotransferase subunit GatA [Nevskiaceae bacterium]|nr:MAG: Asp-tRNA(Asn)/Glu-tRNA(Gln) amidotransferase subunit GatA [Nevskiaceae bacterium]TBR73032.1 MAG: Asp-tRNA(Asn)/Glu-tRNA(Gln) amidotransferase subunit GatA [Nevskiaceae bacterium]